MLLMAALTAGCAGEVAPVPGTLAIDLSGATPGSAGAITLTISGAPLGPVSAASGYRISSRADAAGTHLLVMGPLVSGRIGTIEIPDTAGASRYVAVVEQVADGTTFALLDPSPYRLTLAVTK